MASQHATFLIFFSLIVIYFTSLKEQARRGLYQLLRIDDAGWLTNLRPTACESSALPLFYMNVNHCCSALSAVSEFISLHTLPFSDSMK